MNSKTILKLLFTIVLLGVGGVVTYHFFKIDSIEQIQHVPVYAMVLCLVYVLVQIIKRYVLKSQNWWDWLYYLGLLSVMIPPYMIDEGNASTFIGMANYGTIFLIFPVIGDGIQIFQKK